MLNQNQEKHVCTTNHEKGFEAFIIDQEIFVFSIDTVVAKVKYRSITTEGKFKNIYLLQHHVS